MVSELRDVPRVGLVAIALAASACTGRGDTGQTDDTEVEDTDIPVDTDTDGDCAGDGDYSGMDGFVIEGTAIDLDSGGPAAAGLCVHAADPTPLITGLGTEPTILASSTVCPDGSFVLEDIQTKSGVGVLMIVEDCDNAAEDLVFPSATGIARDDYEGKADGYVVGGRTAWSIDNDHAAFLDAEIAATGETNDLATGSLVGFVLDATDLEPIDGATVTGSSAVLYADTDASDGLFITGSTKNTSTDAAAGSLYVIPNAGITTYGASATGYTFTSRLGGSFDGFAVFIPWLGEPT